jgi:hypothetical protein
MRRALPVALLCLLPIAGCESRIAVLEKRVAELERKVGRVEKMFPWIQGGSR